MSWKNISTLEIYKTSMLLGEKVYEIAIGFDRLNLNTIGYQLIRAADSISANIAEGYGRYHFKDQKRFCYIARGSLFETKSWISKAIERMPEKKDYLEEIMSLLNTLHIKLNGYIKHLDKKLINNKQS